MRFFLLVLSLVFFRSAAFTQSKPQVNQNFPYKVYFGELHNHSIFSFDYKGPEENSEPTHMYQHARHERGYDFFAVTDHNMSPMNRDLHQKGREQAKKATEEGKFIAIYATEFNRGMKEQGHINVLDSPKFFSWEDEDVYVEEGDIKGLYKAIEKNPGPYGPAAQFNHPQTINFDEYEFDETGGRVMKLIETSIGDHGYEDYQDSLSMFHDNIQTALSRGWKLGFSANDDHHDHGWATVYPETTGLWAKSLTKKDIMEAIQNRRSFGMNDTNARALFTANGQIQGSVFNAPGGKIKFYVKIEDPDRGEGVKEVHFYVGEPFTDDKAKIFKTMKGQVKRVNEFQFEHVQPRRSTYYYYARALQADGNFIMISPVWITVP